MTRRETASLLSLAALAAFCATGEELVLDRLLDAARRGDADTVAAVSLVEPPAGVEAWEVVEVGAESREPFRLPEILDRIDEVQGDLGVHRDKLAYLLQDHPEAYEAYKTRRAASPDARFDGELGEFAARYEELLAKQNEAEETVRRLTEEAERERKAAALSVGTKVTEAFEGEVVTKRVRVRLSVSGSPQTATFVLRRYDLVDTERQIRPMARWIVAAIEPEAT